MLMRMLAARPHEPVTRQELVEDLGGGIAEAQERAVDVQITRLRRKIEDRPEDPALPADRARLGLHAGAGLTTAATSHGRRNTATCSAIRAASPAIA